MKINGELTVLVVILLVYWTASEIDASENATDEDAGREFIKNLDETMAKAFQKDALLSWAYETNITDYNSERMMNSSSEVDKLAKEFWVKTFDYPWKNYTDAELKRMFKIFSEVGNPALSAEKYELFNNLSRDMKCRYSQATICDYKNKTMCDLCIEQISNIFANSTDPEELKYMWIEWHKAAGAPSRSNFTSYVELSNEIGKLNGYADCAEWWLSGFETLDIEDQIIALWTQIKPLYEQLHAYVRRNLRSKYGENVVSARGPIPAHLLGNVWAQSWTNVEKFSKPYPEKVAINITAALVANNFTALKMFQSADAFYQSLNFTALPESFWKNSMIEKPKDGREVVCRASASNLYDGENYWIKQCTEVTEEYYYSTYSQMGHIEYYRHYSPKPFILTIGALFVFDDAIGDTMALSATSLKHLKTIGVLPDVVNDAESDINQLYKMSLDKIAFLPFAYLLDIFRYGVYRGTTTSEDYNCHFWQFRETIQGIEPPTTRTEKDFDPAAKYHVSAHIEYIQYYLSYISQYQFQRALCTLAGEYKSGDNSTLLSHCDISNSTAAGNALGKMMSLGGSKPWPDAMEILTGQRNMDASGVLEYFQPLYEWLKADNEKHGEYIGWESSNVTFCTPEQRAKMNSSGFNSRLKKYASS